MVIRAHGSSVDRVFDFVLGCKLSPLLSRPYSTRQCLMAYSYRLLNNPCATAGKAGNTFRCSVSGAHWGGMHTVRFGIASPLFSDWNNEQGEFCQVSLKKKQNLSVADNTDTVKSQIGILQLSVLS